jgi:DNA-binding NarL/FixJ family response regulator
MTVVVIVDDHPTFRQGLRAVLEVDSDIEVVAESGNGEDAVTAATEFAPDVVIMDLRMPGIGGVEAARRIISASPHSNVLVLTMSDADENVFAALQAGARGYLLKEAAPTEIIAAVRAVSAGQGVFGARIAARITAYFSDGAAARDARPFPELSQREREVLELLARGLPNAAIAHQLFLSPKTIRNHVSNVLTKLQVSDRAQAVARARDAGLGNSSR